MAQRLKNFSINFLIFAISIIVTLLLIEGALRIFFPASERGMADLIQVDENLGWSYIPSGSQWLTGPGEFRNFVTINQQGLPDRERAYEKPAGTKRVLMLGDSFVAAHQVPLEKSFSKVTETIVNSDSDSDKPYDFVNAGFAGFGPDQQLRWLQMEGHKYEPDLIVLVVYLGNDIADVDYELSSLGVSTLPPKPFFQLEDGDLVDMGYIGSEANFDENQSVSIVTVRKFLQRNSYIFTIGSGLIKNFERSPQFRDLLTLIGRSSRSTNYNHSYDIFKPETSKQWERAWELLKRTIQEIQLESSRMGSDLYVVLIPHAVQVYPDLWETRKALYPAMEQIPWEMSLPNDQIAEFTTSRQIKTLDLLPQLIEASAENELYFRTDGHLTEAGNAVAGKAISEWLFDEP